MGIHGQPGSAGHLQALEILAARQKNFPSERGTTRMLQARVPRHARTLTLDISTYTPAEGQFAQHLESA
jgi:hypothetical protein